MHADCHARRSVHSSQARVQVFRLRKQRKAAMLYHFRFVRLRKPSLPLLAFTRSLTRNARLISPGNVRSVCGRVGAFDPPYFQLPLAMDQQPTVESTVGKDCNWLFA